LSSSSYMDLQLSPLLGVFHAFDTSADKMAPPDAGRLTVFIVYLDTKRRDPTMRDW
jgi:hypothetical protein